MKTDPHNRTQSQTMVACVHKRNFKVVRPTNSAMKFFNCCLSFVLVSLFATIVEPAQRRGQIYDNRRTSDRGANDRETIANDTSRAIGSGKITEILAKLESDALTAEKDADWEKAAAFYNQASRVALISGQLQKAIDYGNKAVVMAQRGSDPFREARGIVQLSRSLRGAGQQAEAQNWLLKGIDANKKDENTERRKRTEALLYGDLGITLLRQSENQKAIEYLASAVQTWVTRLASTKRRGLNSGLPAQLDNTLENIDLLGVAYTQSGNVDEAIKTYEKGLTIVNETGPRTVLEANLFQGLGRAYIEKKDYSRAQEYLKKALEVADKLRNSSVNELANSEMGDIYRQTQKPAEAIDYYKTAIDSVESTRSQLQSEGLRSGFFEDKQPAYNGMILAQLEANDSAEAFGYNERARSRAFLDILGNKVQLAKEKASTEEEQSLRARLIQIKTDALARRDDLDDEEDVDQQEEGQDLAAAEKAYAEYLSKVKKSNKEQSSLMTVEPLTVKQVQDLVEAGVSLVEYFVTDEAVIAWVVDKAKVNSVRIPLIRKDLQAKVTTFRESIAQLEEADKLNPQAQELHKLLIQPILPHVSGKELLIIPHDALHYLPFQALLAPNGKYLIEDYPINYLSSASLMQFTQEKRKAKGDLTAILSKGGNVLTFGNPDLGDPKMNLRFAEIEAKEINNLYPQSTIYLEKEATEEKAKALVGNSDIIHFASHAELNEDDPLASAIRLAKSDKEDGRLEVREIFGMDLKASLVVLSACETGLGKLSSGDELVGLTRAFIYAGTPSVVASLWNVEDSSTAQLMSSFYKNLKTMTKIEALRQAQLNLIRGNVNSDLLARRGIGGVGKLGETPEAKAPAQESVSTPHVISTSHPYFWAPFVLVGEGT